MDTTTATQCKKTNGPKSGPKGRCILPAGHKGAHYCSDVSGPAPAVRTTVELRTTAGGYPLPCALVRASRSTYRLAFATAYEIAARVQRASTDERWPVYVEQGRGDEVAVRIECDDAVEAQRALEVLRRASGVS